MTNQQERAQAFHALHVKGNPLILYNIWDAGSAKVLEEIGAKAVATGSWAVAAAHGFADRENLPFERALLNLQEIIASVSLPMTLDMEGGYGKSPDELKETVGQVIGCGAIGINFEDQVVGGEGLYSIEEQSRRIGAVRQAAEEASVPLFINARTDIFLKLPAAEHSEARVEEALERAKAYAEAGASGFFAPGLRDSKLIQTLCDSSPLPVNIMMMAGVPSPKELAELGVSRISYGGMPYRVAMDALKAAGQKALALE
jgi:2-methylisocitrate lyase-like PEP mutase family enzyme